MYGHPISKQLERWWAEHGGKHDDPAWTRFLNRFTSYLYVKVDELTSEHENVGEDGEKVFGMSKAGGCTRSAALKLLGYEPEPPSGSTMFTFFTGHVLECAALAMMEALGYTIIDSQARVTIPGLMASASDGIIELYGHPTILSVKTTGYKKSGRERRGNTYIWVRRGFPELPFAGVRKAQPTHWAQMQAEMHATGIRQALYLVLSKDIIKAMEGDPYLDSKEGNGSLAFYAEVVRYNQAFCENQLIPVWEKQMGCVKRGVPGDAFFISNSEDVYVPLVHASADWNPNAERTGTYNPCGYCDLVQACASQASQ